MIAEDSDSYLGQCIEVFQQIIQFFQIVCGYHDNVCDTHTKVLQSRLLSLGLFYYIRE